MKIKKNKSIYIILTLLVGSFELYTFNKIFHPNVSLHYRLYYIDKKLYSWDHGKGIQYDRGLKLNHLTIKRFLSRTGWGRVNNSHAWRVKKGSKIYFIPNHTNKYEGILSLNLISVKEQKMEVIINNNIYYKIIQPKNKYILIYFNPEILNENKINTIEFNFKKSHRNTKIKTEYLQINLNTIKIY